MFNLIGPMIFVGVLVLIAVAIVVNQRIEKQRTERLRELASRLGFDFFEAGTSFLAEAVAVLAFLRRGHSQKIRNLMQKDVRGTMITLCDFTYVTGSGKNRHTHTYTIALFRAPGVDAFPTFELRPEHFFHKIAKQFGYHDIEFDSHPNFSKKYLLRGASEPQIRGVFDTRLLDYLEQEPNWQVEATQDWMVVHRANRVKTDEIESFLAQTTKIHLLFAPRSKLSGDPTA